MVLFDALEMLRNNEIQLFFVGRVKKGQATFWALVLLRGTEGVEENRNGKTSKKDRRRVSALGGL
tara:strand:+ start:1776 stop:1970 length:195 start_codon:yes stop_codon:yes gene_type:complete